jgi:hypothetical protein
VLFALEIANMTVAGVAIRKEFNTFKEPENTTSTVQVIQTPAPVVTTVPMIQPTMIQPTVTGITFLSL